MSAPLPVRQEEQVLVRVLLALKPELDPARVRGLREFVRQPSTTPSGSRWRSKTEGGLGAGASTLFLR